MPLEFLINRAQSNSIGGIYVRFRIIIIVLVRDIAFS